MALWSAHVHMPPQNLMCHVVQVTGLVHNRGIKEHLPRHELAQNKGITALQFPVIHLNVPALELDMHYAIKTKARPFIIQKNRQRQKKHQKGGSHGASFVGWGSPNQH